MFAYIVQLAWNGISSQPPVLFPALKPDCSTNSSYLVTISWGTIEKTRINFDRFFIARITVGKPVCEYFPVDIDGPFFTGRFA